MQDAQLVEGEDNKEQQVKRRPAPKKIVVEKPYEPTNMVFISEEDRRLLDKFNRSLVKKLNITANKSVRV